MCYYCTTPTSSSYKYCPDSWCYYCYHIIHSTSYHHYYYWLLKCYLVNNLVSVWFLMFNRTTSRPAWDQPSWLDPNSQVNLGHTGGRTAKLDSYHHVMQRMHKKNRARGMKKLLLRNCVKHRLNLVCDWKGEIKWELGQLLAVWTEPLSFWCSLDGYALSHAVRMFSCSSSSPVLWWYWGRFPLMASVSTVWFELLFVVNAGESVPCGNLCRERSMYIC